MRRFLGQFFYVAVVTLSVTAFFLSGPPSLLAEDDPTHAMHAAMSMPVDNAVDAATQAKLLAHKSESESNHHLAGFLVLLACLLFLYYASVLQHKVFALLLLVLGFIELQRARGVLKAGWSGWVFPAVAVAGSFMLLLHDHQGGMHGPNHMELMRRIQSQHYSFAVTGLGIAVSKGLAETPFAGRPFFERLFPTLLVVLEALLLVYVE